MPNFDDQNHDQFLRLYAEHEAALHTLLRVMLPSREDAKEALQETIIVLWQKFGEFDPARSFRAWASGIARNKALAVLRDRKRDRLVFDESLVNRLADRAVLHEQSVMTRREVLEGCLQKLPVAQRELVLSAYTKGTRIDDLAAGRGQTPMSLYKLLQRIRLSLLECIECTLATEEPYENKLG
jgi:RNA polymerase sigma-70 factor (ECF subfamily)